MRTMSPQRGELLATGVLALLLASCAQTLPRDQPLVDRVLGEKGLRVQLVEQGAADEHFVHEILHQVGQEAGGERKLARLLAEHLHHHPSLGRATFEELAAQDGFQQWVIERLRRSERDP